MRYLFTFLILIAIGSSLAQEKAPYASYLEARTTVTNAMISFFVKNISDCNIDSITVRIAHNGFYDSYGKDSLSVQLKPGESGVADLNLSQVPSEGWGWTIDNIETSKSDRSSCGYTGTVNFEQIPLGGNHPYPAFTTTPIRSADGSTSYPLTNPTAAIPVTTTTQPIQTDTQAAPATTTQPIQVTSPTNTASANNASFYYVVKGDTLYSLSKRFNLTVDRLKQLNNLTSDNLRLGQKLFLTSNIPNNTNSTNQSSIAINDYQFQYTLYAVQKGETIYSIAKKHLTTVPILMAANCLNSNSVIKATSILKIPKPGAIVTNQCN